MAKPEFETLLYDVADGVATITLNRPDRLNAFTPKMMVDMIAAFDATDADDAVKAVIVTGAGRGFCAGADLGSGAGVFGEGSREAERRAAGDTGDVTRDGGGRLAGHCDVLLAVPLSDTPRIQELHVVTYHAICAAVEARLFGPVP